MREALFILLVLFILLALTAVRYRKQIAGLLSVARMLKEAKRAAASGVRDLPNEKAGPKALVNCSECGVWVPETKAIRTGSTVVCSEKCRQSVTA